MSCEKRREVDFAAFVAEPRAGEWADFRAHYPVCRDCSAEMLRWTALEGALRSVTDTTHPSEELLLAYRRAPESLSQAQRDELATHLEACAPCRDALGAVLSLDLKQLLAAGKPASAPEPARGGQWQRVLDNLRGLFELPLPALAAAALAVLLLALGIPYLYQGGGELSGETPPPIAQREEPPVRPLEAPRALPQRQPEELAHEAPPPPAPERPPAQLAQAPPAEPGTPERVETPAAPDAPPVEVAQQAPAPAPETAPAPRPVSPPPKPAPAPPQPAETWIIASLGPKPLLYSAPGDLPGGRIGGSARGAAAGPGVLALVPEQVGLTLEARPTLYFYLPAATEQPLQLRVNDIDAMKTLLSTTLRPPLAAGIHAVPLAERGVTLGSGRNYEWVLSVPGSDDEGSGGILRRVAPSESLRASLAGASPAERVRLLAANGIWYDALDMLSRSIERRPQDAALRQGRAELLEQAGLTAPAAWDRSH